MKKAKPLKQFHTAPTKKGQGDYMGVGVKQPAGKIRDIMGSGRINMKKSMKPPKSLA